MRTLGIRGKLSSMSVSEGRDVLDLSRCESINAELGYEIWWRRPASELVPEKSDASKGEGAPMG